MGQHATTKTKFTGAILGALTAGALATAGLGPAPAANATCASFFGIASGGNCTSTLTTVAIAIGTNAQAHADGILGTALALGNGSFAGAYGWFGSATALGNQSFASATYVGIALAAGPKSKAGAGAAPGEFGNVAMAFGGSDAEAYGGSANLAVSLFGDGSSVMSLGNGNLAVNVGGSNFVHANGTLSSAINLIGHSNLVQSSSNSALSSAFNVLGNGNTAMVGAGPVAIAGTIFQQGNVVTKSGPGFNINGVVVGGTAAVKPAAKSHRAAKAAAPAAGTHIAAASHTARK